MAKHKEFNTEQIVKVVRAATKLASDCNHEYVTLEHLMAVLLNEHEVINIFTEMEIDLSVVKEQLDDLLSSHLMPEIDQGQPPSQTDTLKHTVQQVVAQVMFSSRTEALPTDLLIGILQQANSHANNFLQEEGMTLLALKEYLSHGNGQADEPNQRQGVNGPDGETKQKDITNKADALKLLAKYCSNLNEVVATGTIDPVIGREDEVAAIIQVVSRRTKQNIVLVGEPGVGKCLTAKNKVKVRVSQELFDLI